MAEPSQQEEFLGKAYDIRLIRRLWNFIVPYKRLFWMAMLLLPLQQAFGLAQPYLMKIGIDQYIAGRDLWGLQGVGLLFLAAVVGETVTLFFHYYLSMLVAQRCLADLRVAVFPQVPKLPLKLFRWYPGGQAGDPHDHGRRCVAGDVLVRCHDPDFRLCHGVLDHRHHVLSSRRVGFGFPGANPADGSGD